MKQELFKIIGVSNHMDESMSDTLICENISKYWGEKFVEFMNKNANNMTLMYYRLVPSDHKLYKFEP